MLPLVAFIFINCINGKIGLRSFNSLLKQFVWLNYTQIMLDYLLLLLLCQWESDLFVHLLLLFYHRLGEMAAVLKGGTQNGSECSKDPWGHLSELGSMLQCACSSALCLKHHLCQVHSFAGLSSGAVLACFAQRKRLYLSFGNVGIACLYFQSH